MAAVLTATALLYAPSLRGARVWDDYSLIDGTAIGGGQNFWNCFTQPFLGNFFRPLVSVNFFLERRLFGENPIGYHVVSLAIHLITVALLGALVFRVTKSRRIGLISAALYGVQSCRLGSVAWIGGRTDTLLCLWAVLSLWSLAKAAESAKPTKLFLFSALCYALAMLTKEQGLALLPAAPLAMLWLLPKSNPTRTRYALQVSAMWLACAVAFLAVGSRMGLPKPTAGLALYSLPEIAQMAGASITHYLLLMFVPNQTTLHLFGLATYRDYGPHLMLAGLVLAGVCMGALLRIRRTQPGAAWLFAVGLFTLLPILNLLPVPFLQLAPYRASLPGIGFCVAAAVLFLAGKTVTGVHRQICTLAMGFVMIWNIANTLVSSQSFGSEEVLFKTLVERDPKNPVARYLLAYHLVSTSRPAEAVPHWEAELTMLYGDNRWKSSEGALAGLRDKVIRRRLRQSQGSTDPEHLFASSLLMRLAYARLMAEQTEAAADAYIASAAVNPLNTDSQQGAGYTLLLLKRYPESRQHSAEAVKQDEFRTDAWINLVRAEVALGDDNAIKKAYAGWMKSAPDQPMPYLELAKRQLERKDISAAAETLTEALKKWPDRADIRSLMAVTEAGGLDSGNQTPIVP